MKRSNRENCLVVIYKIPNVWYLEKFNKRSHTMPIKLPLNKSELNFIDFHGQSYEYYHFILTDDKKKVFLEKLKKSIPKVPEQHSLRKMIRIIDKILWKNATYNICFKVTSDKEQILWRNFEKNVESPIDNKALNISLSDYKSGKITSINEIYKEIIESPYEIQHILIDMKKEKDYNIIEKCIMEGVVQFNYNSN